MTHSATPPARLGGARAPCAVLYLGTVVTGSGPHAGDGGAKRTGLDPQVFSHVHAGGVYLLVALTVGLLLLARRAGATGVTRAAGSLLAAGAAPGRRGIHPVLPGPARGPRRPAHARRRAHLGRARLGGRRHPAYACLSLLTPRRNDGENRLIHSMQRHQEHEAQRIVSSVIGELQTFSPQEQHDDITLIVAKCRANA